MLRIHIVFSISFIIYTYWSVKKSPHHVIFFQFITEKLHCFHDMLAYGADAYATSLAGFSVSLLLREAEVDDVPCLCGQFIDAFIYDVERVFAF